MTEIKLSIRKSLEKNAGVYFENAKHLKAKIAGIRSTIDRFEKKLNDVELQESVAVEEDRKKQQKKLVEKKWFEKFHWFLSSEGFLCVGGRDATSNEVVVKKHADRSDVIFHTEAAGSPFFVVKSEGKKIGELTLSECAVATVAYSKAWKLGLASTDVYWVLPEQVSKQTESGEYVSKGAFVIRGKKNNLSVEIKLAVGVMNDGKIMAGPLSAVAKHCEKYILVVQGDDKSSDCAKKIIRLLGTDDVNDVVSVLPAGGCRVMKA